MRSLFFCLFLIALRAMAQDGTAFIEVTVEDTALAPTTRIVYSCSVQGSNSDMASAAEYAMFTASSAKEKKRLAEEMQRKQDSACMDQTALNTLLAARGYHLIPSLEVRNDGYTVDPGSGESCTDAALVELASEEQLKELVALIRSRGNVHGEVSLWERNTRDHDKQALARMYADAHAQAQDLATVAGRKLGPMVDAREASALTGNDDVRLAMLAYRFGGGGTMPGSRSMTFRFALVP